MEADAQQDKTLALDNVTERLGYAANLARLAPLAHCFAYWQSQVYGSERGLIEEPN